MITAYIKYLIKSGNEHAIHSPFLFELYTQVISNKNEQHPDFESLNILRKKLLNDKSQIEILDLGAGSRMNKSNTRSVATIVKNAEKPAKFGKLFHRLVRRFKPKSIVELGTSLGLTTLYFSKASEQTQITTFEGCPETSKIALQNFKDLGAKNTELILGNIDQTLPEFVKTLTNGIDLLYIDANHRFEPTVRYFETCLPYANNDSIFIFDDIYWSAEMTQAWEHIKAHPDVTLTVDLFWIGLVFFRKEQLKEDFVLRF